MNPMELIFSVGGLLAEEAAANSMDAHFSLAGMWNQMGIVGKATVIVLLLMSMSSIYVMIDRTIAFMLARKVRRISIRRPRRLAASRRVRTSSSGSARRAIASFAAAISAAVICAKSFFCSNSRSETVRLASISKVLSSLRSFNPENKAS